jgi:hypothetical protein
MAFRQPFIPRIAATGTSLSLLPCQAWEGYRVTNAHRVEVKVGADGPASAPKSGPAAAAPPAGASVCICKLIFIHNLNLNSNVITFATQ